MKINEEIFGKYDIRGIYPDDLNASVAFNLGNAIASYLQEKTIAIGKDMRTSSDEIAANLIKGIIEQGIDVIEVGLICTDMIYYLSGKYQIGGVMVTASHNPPEYNGMKIVKSGAIALSGEEGIYQIRDLVMKEQLQKSSQTGQIKKKDYLREYIQHALNFVDVNKIKPFKIVIDAGNGMAGKIIPAAAKHLPVKIIPLYFELDGHFPNHIPNPLDPDNVVDLQKKIVEEKTDLGVAFDGDGDRMYLFDEKGEIVSGTITTALIAESLLEKNKGETILYNAVCGRIVPKTIKEKGGKAIRVPVGHSIIKQKMREHNALFAGEHSGHYFFRDNYYADSGLIAMLIAFELISQENRPVSAIVKKYNQYFPSGEINFKIKDKEGAMKKLEALYKHKAKSTDWLHGITVWFDDWWFNSYPSGTEPLLRLNIEADNQRLLKEKINELVSAIEKLGAKKES